MTTVSQRIADFASALTWDVLPAAVREKSKVTLLHNLGVALAGAPLCEAPLRYARALEESGTTASARLLANGAAATPDTAARPRDTSKLRPQAAGKAPAPAGESERPIRPHAQLRGARPLRRGARRPAVSQWLD